MGEPQEIPPILDIEPEHPFFETPSRVVLGPFWALPGAPGAPWRLPGLFRRPPEAPDGHFEAQLEPKTGLLQDFRKMAFEKSGRESDLGEGKPLFVHLEDY